MFTLLKYVISIAIWAIVAAALLIAKNPELFAFWVLIGGILVVAWVIKFVWKWIFGIFFPTLMARSYFIFVLVVLILALAAYQLILVPRFNHWGVSEDEVKNDYPVDKFLPEARTVAFRAFTIEASVDKVYPWIKQLATEGILNLNINIFDFIRNKPARLVIKDLPTFNIGDRFLIGEIVQSKNNQSLTLQLNRNRFPWSKFKNIYVGYYLHRDDRSKTRVIIKIKADYDSFIAWFSSKYLIELGDFWVSRYYFNTIISNLEGSVV
jgi:hypothetical protein